MILLDTNALLWVYRGREIGGAARALIETAPRVHYSSVSISEIAIKHMLGRIQLPGGERFPQVFDDSGLIELPFSARHAAALTGEPPLVRHDPFDRMILAQAASEGLTLLTSDQVLLDLGYRWVRDARV